MRPVIPLLFVALASATILRAKSGATMAPVIETNVCELVKRSKHFDKANVRVRAIIESDLIEHTDIVDNECPARGISLWIPHELDDSADVRALRSELRKQWAIPASNTKISAVFEGRFLREHRKLYFKVFSIDHIDVTLNKR